MTKKSPDFHFSKSLSTALRFTTKGLLSNKRVRAYGAHMYFIFHHVIQFENVHITDSRLLFKSFAGATVIKLYLAIFIPTGLFQFLFYFLIGGAGKRWHDGLITKSFSCQTQMHFQYLTQVHTRRDAKRSKNNINGSAIFGIWHIFNRQYF